MSFAKPDPVEASLSPAQSVVPEVEISSHHQERSDWSIFHRIAYRVRRPGGEWVRQEREFLDRGDAVALLPYCPETGHVLLTRQFRMPIYVKRPAESLLVEVCGGILDDVDPEVTVRHEAIEELGLELGPVEKVFEAYSTPGSVCEKAYFFVAPYSPGQRRFAGGGRADEGEDVEVLEMPLAEAVRLVSSGEILDLRTVALVMYLAASRR